MTTRESPPTLPVVLLLLWAAVTMALWALAFYRAPEVTPEWLLRAQAVCFGSGETGLPDTYGWMVLALGPLSFLAGLLVALGREVRWGLAAMAGTVGGKGLMAVVLMTLLIEGVWVEGRIAEGMAVASADHAFAPVEELPLDYPRTQRAAPSFSLVDQHGARVTPEGLRGQVVFLTFAFAHCKTVCPVILSNVLQASERFESSEFEVLVITLDPWRDTPRSLPTLASHWNLGDDAHVLSGPVDEVSAALDAYNVPGQRDLQTGDITHPALVYVLDRDGQIAYSFNNPNVEWLSEAARRLLEPADLAVDHRR
ncbi:MAG: SCO family protein [Candidatus Latescibacteria bacterium]|jgi:protein SCO1/2|nr:SCO family protein [Candidatus Latescibacterota bacterium]